MFVEIMIKKLLNNCFIKTGLSIIEDKPSIFPYSVPISAIKPYITFFTSEYKYPLKSATKIFTVEYINNEMDEQEAKKYTNEIIGIFDALIIDKDEYGELRFFIYGNPLIDLDAGKVVVSFLLRGDLDDWGVE